MIIDIETRVQNGIDFLNEEGPVEWWDRIDLERLDILDGTVCVLGQVFAAKADETGFHDGYMYALRTFVPIDNAPAFHGFCDDGTLADPKLLKQEWTSQVEKIRAEVAA